MTDLETNTSRRFHIQNPLTLISVFVGAIELIATYPLVKSLEQPSSSTLILTWFVTLFPVAIAATFFVFLWFKNTVLFGPSDFRDERLFADLQKQIETLEERQDRILEASVRTLAEKDDVYTAIHVGRTSLREGQYEVAERIFEYLQSQDISDAVLKTRVMANLAYAYNGLGKYQQAISNLEQVRSERSAKSFKIWHIAALAYAHFKLKHDAECQALLRDVVTSGAYKNRKQEVMRDYPDMVAELLKAESENSPGAA